MKKLMIILAVPVVVLLVLFLATSQSDEPTRVVEEVFPIHVEEPGPSPLVISEPAPELPAVVLEDNQPEVLAPVIAAVEPIKAPKDEPPQGEPVLKVPSDQVLDDPREFGGVIIPRSNSGIYVPGLKAEMSISSGAKSGRLSPNQVGAFPTVVIIPNGKAEVTLSYPELSEGTEVKLYCPDGGTIDGEASSTRKLSGGGTLSFEWEGNDNLGRHTVHCVAGPNEDEKVISFWVGPRAYADASSVPRS